MPQVQSAATTPSPVRFRQQAPPHCQGPQRGFLHTSSRSHRSSPRQQLASQQLGTAPRPGPPYLHFNIIHEENPSLFSSKLFQTCNQTEARRLSPACAKASMKTKTFSKFIPATEPKPLPRQKSTTHHTIIHASTQSKLLIISHASIYHTSLFSDMATPRHSANYIHVYPHITHLHRARQETSSSFSITIN
jgi:hypothetical protein